MLSKNKNLISSSSHWDMSI